MACEDRCRRFTDTEAETMFMAVWLLEKRARFTVAPHPSTRGDGDCSEFEFPLRHAKAFDTKLRSNLYSKSYRIDPIDKETTR